MQNTEVWRNQGKRSVSEPKVGFLLIRANKVTQQTTHIVPKQALFQLYVFTRTPYALICVRSLKCLHLFLNLGVGGVTRALFD
jgi:hypothetical protein